MPISRRSILLALLAGACLAGVAALTGVAAPTEAAPQAAAEWKTRAYMVERVNVRLRTAPSFDAPEDSLLPIGAVVVVNRATQPRDTSWIHVGLTLTGEPGYVHRSLLRPIPQGGAAAMAEAIATERLARRGDPFTWRAQLYGMLNYQREMPTEPDRGARIVLLWLQSFRSMLASIPRGEEAREPYRSWFVRAVDDGFITIGEPSGRWSVASDSLFSFHEPHRERASGDEIAWTIRDIGIQTDCAARVTCTVASLNSLDAEYLRRYRDGSHAVEALDRIRAEAIRGVNAPGGEETFVASRDCEDLVASLASVRAAVALTTVGENPGVRGVPAAVVTRTLAALDELAARCPA